MGFKKLLITFLLMMGVVTTFAQVTTSSMQGVIKDSKGEGLFGATVKATHVPSGTVYGTTTQLEGRYTIPNMRAGGPYKVEVTYVGYTAQTYNDIQLKLGSAFKLDATLGEDTKTLTEVNITGQRNGLINPNRNGTSTNISRNQIDNLPTVTRSVQDFARLSMQASTYSNGSDGSPMGISFGGQSNKYNQFAIDGANTSDVFGLSSSGTNGGQSGGNPISIEAIDQIQVVQNPYDIKQGGFTGGGINAITKSGTNKFQGSLYGLYQNQDLVGKSQSGGKYGNFNNKIFGATVGGPIIKNKLFFFLNYERGKQVSPVDFNPADPSTGGSAWSTTTLQQVSDILKSRYNYDAGSYTDLEKEKPSTNFLARVDWNINAVHKLTVRHSLMDASNILGSRSRSGAIYNNSFYSFPSTSNNTTIELNSSFSPRMSNELRIGFNITQDRRKYLGDPFPYIRINDAGGSTLTIGADNSSQVNKLNQKIWTITDNLTLYRGAHTITFGTNNEFYNIQNDFIQNNFGNYTYASLADFVNNAKPSAYQVTYTTADRNLREGIKFNAMQLGFYVQDEWDILSNLRVTGGLRVDIPVINTDPIVNEAFDKNPAFAGYSTATLPKTRLMFAPRIGFNYDVFKDGKTQLRGGTGIFTGRVPFVWISNQYNNNGSLYSSVNLRSTPASFTFRPDPNNQWTLDEILALPGGGSVTPLKNNVNLTDKNFKFPQAWKSNIAVDQQLPWGIIGTIEANYSKTLNNTTWENINIVKDGDKTIDLGDGPRPMWKVNSTDYDQVIVLKNTNKGYAYNLSTEFTKTTKNGLFAKVGYSYGESKALNDGTSSTASSNYRFSPNTLGLNNPEYGYSKYRMGSRVVGVVSKTFRYGKNKGWATGVTLFYNGQSGTPYSWVYFNSGANDPTGDDTGTNGNNDLVFIGTKAQVQAMNFIDIVSGGQVTVTAAQQKQDWEDYISNDKYLSKHRGEAASKYAARTPFEHVFDFKFVQDLPIVKGHKIQLTFDVLNVGNMLNKEWGRTYFISNNVATPLTITKSGGVTAYQFNKTAQLNNIDGDYKAYYINNFTSRWRGQIGIKYTFNQ
ncbi:TonB-dependent receptor-like protein [Chitinophaga skermanii]|uniref:TonB-dependent receptor-like protein n=1 Tax=Chitinophaga skermanii TaxID=331697 RepID=A0A327QL32_9BACT|nr:carboxypeptidase regulatory-like domain-containing protein [Chitinophaga skermanii]RAJ05249.1 TonB-dependent receptor-like protein [Chitinophaga skermanii]